MSNMMNICDLANDIYKWCKQNDVWENCTIYFDGDAWSDAPKWNGEQGKKMDDDLYLYSNKNPFDYLQYANPDTLSFSFDGSLYDIVNDFGYTYPAMYESFGEVFDKHGYYYELGSSWYLTVAEKQGGTADWSGTEDNLSHSYRTDSQSLTTQITTRQSD